MMPSRSPWIVRRAPQLYASLRLIRFPTAGGGAAIYPTWGPAAPAWIDDAQAPCPAVTSLPEAPLSNVAAIVRPVVAAIADLIGRLFAVYGHSLLEATVDSHGRVTGIDVGKPDA